MVIHTRISDVNTVSIFSGIFSVYPVDKHKCLNKKINNIWLKPRQLVRILVNTRLSACFPNFIPKDIHRNCGEVSVLLCLCDI